MFLYWLCILLDQFSFTFLVSVNDSHIFYTKKNETEPLQLHSSDFCRLMNDVDYVRATGLFEKAESLLYIMWTPAGFNMLSNNFVIGMCT